LLLRRNDLENDATCTFTTRIYIKKTENLNKLVLNSQGKKVQNTDVLLPFAKKTYNAVESLCTDVFKASAPAPRRLQIFYTPDDEFFSVVVGCGVKKKEQGLSDSASTKYNICKYCAEEGLFALSVSIFDSHKRQGIFDDAHLDGGPCFDKSGPSLTTIMEECGDKLQIYKESAPVAVLPVVQPAAAPAGKRKRGASVAAGRKTSSKAKSSTPKPVIQENKDELANASTSASPESDAKESSPAVDNVGKESSPAAANEGGNV
jgi:hypothetical protein